jgi:hypothetical protein
MRRFTPEEEAILKGQLQVTPNYRALWTPQEGRASPADGTGWVWLGMTPNTPAVEADRAWFAAHPPIGTTGSSPRRRGPAPDFQLAELAGLPYVDFRL